MRTMQDYLAGDDDDAAGLEIAGLEIAGYDESGAPLFKKSAKSTAAARPQRQPAPKVYATPPQKKRTYPLGIDSIANVAAAASGPYAVSPQVPFKPLRLIVTGPTNWLITDIKVGKNSQLAGGSLTADAFGPGSFDSSIDFDTCNLGAQVSVTVTNISGGPLRFLGTFLGYAVE